MKVKLKSHEELKKLGYIFREYPDKIILSNGDGSWRCFSKDAFKTIFEVTDTKSHITHYEFQAFRDLFTIDES